MGNKSNAILAVGKIARENQYLLLQDGCHGFNSNPSFAMSRDVIDQLATAGYKHYVVEILTSQQPEIDLLVAGKINRNEYAKNRTDLRLNEKENQELRDIQADLILYAAEKGIKVHAIDKRSSFGSLDTEVSILRRDNPNEAQSLTVVGLSKLIDSKISDKTIGSYELERLKLADKALSKMNIADNELVTGKQFIEECGKQQQIERVQGDKWSSSEIKKVSKGEKTAIYYGAGHGCVKDGKNGKDLDEWLGEGKVGKVFLIPNNKIYSEVMKLGELSELTATVIYTDASIRPGRQIKAWQEQAHKIGEEIKMKDFDNLDFKALKATDLRQSREQSEEINLGE